LKASDVMRLEFRQLGIQVAVIEPGFVGTEMGGKLQRDTEGAVGSLPDDGRRRYGANRMLFMRRILPDRQFDRIVLRAGGLDGF
jgi:NAD(P)-dependent dehydrogenase (short-subunit alcohol dehydrogenase family)